MQLKHVGIATYGFYGRLYWKVSKWTELSG